MKKIVMMIDLGVSNSTKTLITACNLQDTKKKSDSQIFKLTTFIIGTFEI